MRQEPSGFTIRGAAAASREGIHSPVANDSGLPAERTGNRVSASRPVFGSGLGIAVERELDERQIHQALVDGDLFLEYMPAVSLRDGRCLGGEALVRWRRGDRILMPMEFVPEIENTPVAGLLTCWVIDTVAAELGGWLQATPVVHVGINVPPEVLGRGGLEYAARKSHLLAVRDRILLEVTERGIPDRLGLGELKELAANGVLIGLDDVGSNNNNLLVLFQAPVDVIKLDKRIVDRCCGEGADDALGTLAPLIRASGRIVIAEHVEREEQARLLAGAGVQMAQGFLYSKPLSAAAFIAWQAAHA